MPNLAMLRLLENREAWNKLMLERSADREILDLSETNLEGADLSGYLFSGINFAKAKLNGANLSRSRFDLVDLTEAELRGANLTEASLNVVLAIEADFANATLRRAWCISIQAVKAIFVGASLWRCGLNGRFDEADFSEADLRGSDLRAMSCADASFRDANLSEANLASANLEGTDLRGANFEGTNLENAAIYRTIPDELDLSAARNVPSSQPRKVYGFASAPGGSSGGTLYDPPESERTATMIRVFYATDRAPDKGRRIFGSRRSAELSFGHCDVSIPLYDRNMGEVPRPSLWKLEFRENLRRHVAIVRFHSLTREEFQSELASENEHGKREVLLFIHGYNVSFEDAVRRTAQLAHDLNFEGMPLIYSWTSQNTLRGYPADLANNEMTWGKLASFLCQLGLSSGSVHLICHSMGGRALCHATTLLANECPNEKVRLKNLIFAAPDVHVPSFEETLPNLRELGGRITLYFCPKDLALEASKRFHSVPRVGEEGIIATGLDDIDISAFSGTFPYHSGYGVRGVMADIFEIINHGTSPDARFGLSPVRVDRGTYFRMQE
jgi:esterase/lipase superfamily enzyme/uncharacterized protein YjbI with pentapeptide repeats